MVANVCLPQAAHDVATMSPLELAQHVRTSACEEEWFYYYFYAVADLLGLEFEVRAPFWLLQPNYMQTQFSRAFGQIVTQLGRLGLQAHVTRQSDAKDLTYAVSKRRIVLSFHTFGAGQNLWHLKDAPLRDRFFFNRGGYSGWVDISDQQRAFVESGILQPYEREDILNFARAMTEANISALPQPARTELKLPPKAVFFPLQLIDDTVAQHCYFSMLEAIVSATVATKSAGRALIIKRHPLCQNSEVAAVIARALEQSHVQTTDASIHDAIAASELVLTANSSVGFTSVLHGKPLITFAKSEYGLASNVVTSSPELVRALLEKTPTHDLEQQLRYIKVFRDELTFHLADDRRIRAFIIEAFCQAIEGLDPK